MHACYVCSCVGVLCMGVRARCAWECAPGHRAACLCIGYDLHETHGRVVALPPHVIGAAVLVKLLHAPQPGVRGDGSRRERSQLHREEEARVDQDVLRICEHNSQRRRRISALACARTARLRREG